MNDHNHLTFDPNSSADLAELAAEGSARTIVKDDATALALVGYRVGALWIASAAPRTADGRLLFHVEHVGTGQVEHDRAELNGNAVGRVGGR